jgi:hypothetical protein
MYRYKIFYLFLIVYWCCSPTKCDLEASEKSWRSYITGRSRNVQARSTGASLHCEQYANDLEILSHFPFTINFIPQQQGPDKSTAILDPSGTEVIMIQLRQAGSIVPESVFCLKHLQSLDIRNMFFVNGIVPDALSNLQLLTSLYITNTPITKFTHQVATLQRLEMLSVDNCALSHMPSLSGMSKLYSVILPNNRLSKLEGLMNVYMLSLYKNLFTEIPTQTEPGKLVRLDMNYNPVKHMAMITSYSNLTDIRLSNTQISVIPPAIHELENLSFLDVSFSQITHLPKTLLKLARLQYLVVQGNSFSAEEINSIQMDFSTQRPGVTVLI